MVKRINESYSYIYPKGLVYYSVPIMEYVTRRIPTRLLSCITILNLKIIL